jgi:hypothetical protein
MAKPRDYYRSGERVSARVMTHWVPLLQRVESVLAFQKVSHLIPADAPVILESRVEESEINQEMENALNALSTKNQFEFVGD